MPKRIKSDNQIVILERYLSDLYALLMKNLALYMIAAESSEARELETKVRALIEQVSLTKNEIIIRTESNK